jgi:uncharacterized protein (TIGR02145 family)
LYELNENFIQTGRSFFDIIADDRGNFEIKDVELASPYALLEADGFYRNEVTGGISKASIKLYAIADVREKDNININLLTHLEYYRVLALAEGGKTIAEAKKQAQKEILAVFGIDGAAFASSEDMSIFGTAESDAALLAISVLMQGDLSEGEFSQRLTDFALSLKTSGKWDSGAEKNKMADWASGADLDGISNNILAWGLSAEVPGFGKYVYGYWVASYGLGECNASNERDAKKEWICKNGAWRLPSYKDIVCAEDKNCAYFTDARDNQSYAYVAIGEQIWMAENLNYEIENSRCYNDSSAYCNIYGRLYDWNTAMKVCPPGWHLPSQEEWEALTSYIESSKGCSGCDAMHLKARGWIGGGGLDSYGFAALMGSCVVGNSVFGILGNDGRWWGSTESSSYGPYYQSMLRSYGDTSWSFSYDDVVSFSVRCLRD